MTIETKSGGLPVTKSGPYLGNGVTTVFAYAFQIQAATEIVVTRQNADLTQTVLALTTNYTVDGVGSSVGGNVTLLVAPATGTSIVLQYAGDFNQTTAYSNQGALYLSVLENSLDKITMHLRELKEKADRTVSVDAFNTVDLATLTTNISSLSAISSDIALAAAHMTDIVNAPGYASAAATSEANAASDATAAAGSASTATTQAGTATTQAGIATTKATAAAASYAAIQALYLGAHAADPATDNLGGALQTGAWYYNTTTGKGRVWNGSAWNDVVLDPTNVAITGGSIRGVALASPESFLPITTGGTNTAYTISTGATAYVDGQNYRFALHATNGAAPTIQDGALAAMPFKVDNAGTLAAPAAGQMVINTVIEAVYSASATAMIITNGLFATAAVAATGTATGIAVDPAGVAAAIAALTPAPNITAALAARWISSGKTKDVTYFNSNSTPLGLAIVVTGNNQVSNTTWTLEIGEQSPSMSWTTLCVATTANNLNSVTLSGIVPPGAYYRLASSQANAATASTWLEALL